MGISLIKTPPRSTIDLGKRDQPNPLSDWDEWELRNRDQYLDDDYYEHKMGQENPSELIDNLLGIVRFPIKPWDLHETVPDTYSTDIGLGLELLTPTVEMPENMLELIRDVALGELITAEVQQITVSTTEDGCKAGICIDARISIYEIDNICIMRQIEGAQCQERETLPKPKSPYPPPIAPGSTVYFNEFDIVMWQGLGGTEGYSRYALCDNTKLVDQNFHGLPGSNRPAGIMCLPGAYMRVWEEESYTTGAPEKCKKNKKSFGRYKKEVIRYVEVWQGYDEWRGRPPYRRLFAVLDKTTEMVNSDIGQEPQLTHSSYFYGFSFDSNGIPMVYDEPPIPPPDEPPVEKPKRNKKDKKRRDREVCCPEQTKLLRKIAKATYGGKNNEVFGGKLTELVGKKSKVKFDSIPQMLAHMYLQFDSVLGHFPLRIEFKDGDLTQEGNQGGGTGGGDTDNSANVVEFPNLAEMLGDIYSHIFKGDVESEVAYQIIQRLPGELQQVKNVAIRTHDECTAISNFLGFDKDYEAKDVPTAFNFDLKDGDPVHKFLTATKFPLKTARNRDKGNLSDAIQTIHFAAEIIKAVYTADEGDLERWGAKAIANAEKTDKDDDPDETQFRNTMRYYQTQGGINRAKGAPVPEIDIYPIGENSPISDVPLDGSGGS